MTLEEPAAQKTSEETLAALEAAINLHFKTMWKESGDEGLADYIPDWAVVIAFQDFGDADQKACAYSMETRSMMQPHAIRGLLEEGLDWLAEQRMSDD